MGGPLPKPLVPLAGKPLINHLLDTLHQSHLNKIALVIGHQADRIKAYLGDSFEYVMQPEPLGTAHAVMCAAALIKRYEKVLILMGDNPLLLPETLKNLLKIQSETASPAAILTGRFETHFPYARVVRDEQNHLVKCVEERDATENELKIREYMTSQFLFESSLLLQMLPQLQPYPVTSEIYLTDLVNLCLQRGVSVETLAVAEFQQLVGLNTPDDIRWAEIWLNDRLV